MLHMMLERGESIHSVVFFDTGWEFPEMHDHINLVERKTGIEVVRLAPDKPFAYWMYERVKTKGRVGQVGYCWPNKFDRWCTELKTGQIDKITRKIKNLKPCIGYASDEMHRVKPGPQRYPLIEYGITEADAIKYCRDLGYTWGGLYDIFNRVSCWCCPLQSIKDLRKLRKHRPELWEKLLEMDARQPSNSPGFKDYWRVEDFERRFAREESYPSDIPAHVVRRMMKQPQKNFFEHAETPCHGQ